MNTNILKAILLFVGVLVSSHPTDKPVAEVPDRFKMMKLQSIIFKDGDFSYFGAGYLNTQIQVSLASWKPGVPIPQGTWDLYLVAKDRYYYTNNNLTLKIAEIEYNGTEHNWDRIQDLKWVNIPIDLLLEYTIMLKASNIIASDKEEFKNSSAQNWTYNIFFKTKDSILEGIREDENDLENPTAEFCSRDIFTVGPNKTLAALCKLDPDTKKPMERCLNWRRIDNVGSKCRWNVMNPEIEEKSMDVFCAKDHYLADCRCINRRYYKEYQELKLTEKLPDFCWYFPCASGAYLTKRKGEKVLCINTRCEPVYFLGIQYDVKCTQTETGYPDGLSEPMANPDY